MKKVFFVGVLIVIASGAIFSFSQSAATSGTLHSVELSVSRLSCGSCVETIRQAVTALNGTGKVETNVEKARSYVEFNAREIGADKIAQTITGSGYPATVLFVRNSAGDLLSGIDLDRFVARVGSQMITRDEFNQAFQKRMQIAETSGQPVPVRTISQDAWTTLLRQKLLLNAAEQFGVVVNDADLQKRLLELGGPRDNQNIDELHNTMAIDEFLAIQFPKKKPNAIEVANLLNGLQSNTVVDIYDENLNKNLSSRGSGSGCGGSCCG